MLDKTFSDDWIWVTLEDVQEPHGHAIVSGPFGSNIGSRFFVNDGVPVIRGNNLTTDMTRFIDDGFVFVTEDKASELAGCEAIAGDLIFTAAGSLGQVGLIPSTAKYPKYIISNKQMRARLNRQKVDPLFAFYWFSSPWMVEYINNRNTGSSVPLINLSILRSLPLPLPPLSEQRAIAHVLGTLDDKIELNRRMNQTLEAMAQALFKSWFVDFDPVRAKAEGRRPAGMDEEMAAMFPDEFEESELGEIPKGWKVSKLGEVVAINEHNITQDYSYQNIDYIDISSVNVGRLEATTNYELKDAPSRAKRLVSHGDTIWSCVRPNRKSFLYIHQPSPNLVVSTGFVVLTPKAVTPCYLYAWVTTDLFVEYLSYNADGSAYPAIRPDRFAYSDILLPSIQLLKQFEQQVRPIRDRIAHNERESINLATIRDLLLPKLLSGEIRVKREILAKE